MIEIDKKLALRFAAMLALAAATACSVDAAGQIPCADDASCPADYPVCQAGKCVAGTGSTAAASASVVGVEGKAPADPVRGTVVVTATARASSGIQSVSLAGGGQTFAPATSANGTYTFTVDTTLFTDGDVALTATVTPGDSTVAPKASDPFTLHVDNTPPSLTVGVVGTTEATDGTLIAVDVTSTEPLASLTGAVSESGTALAQIAPPTGTTYHFGYAVTAADTSGTHSVSVTGSDAAGNVGGKALTGAFTVHHPFAFGPLAVSTGHTVNEQAGALPAATVGTVVNVSVTVPSTAALGTAKPVFTLTSAGGTARTLAAPTVATGTTTSTWSTSYAVVSGDNDGVASVAVAVADVAGNTPAPATASLFIDKSAPLASAIAGGGSFDTVHHSAVFTAVASKRLQAASISSTNFDSGTCTCDGGACDAGTSATPVVSCTVTVSHPAVATPTVTLSLTDTLGNSSPATAAYQSSYSVVAAPTNGGLAGTTTIGQGQVALLTPTFSNGVGVVNGSDGSSYAATSGTGIAVSPSATATYTLTVTNAAGSSLTSTAATVTVVAPPVITSFTGPSFYVAGQPVGALTAVFTPATGATATVTGNDGTSIYTCTASPDSHTSPATFTCQTPANAADVTYTLTVTGGPVSVTANLQVKVAPDPAASIAFTVNGSNPINPGGSTTFTGTVCSGCTFTIDPSASIASSSVSGTTLSAATTALQNTTIFTLTVTNQAGATARTTQTVNVRTPTIASFTGPSVVAANTSFSVTADFGPGAITGATAASAAVSGASCGGSSTTSPHTFTCTAGIAADTTLTLQVTLGTGANSQISVNLPVKVASDTSTTALTTLTSTVNPGDVVTFGGTVCTGCAFTLEPAASLNGAPTLVGTALSAVTNPLQATTTFVLTVTNQVGVSTTATQTITVRAPAIASFTGPDFVSANTSFTVTADFGPGVSGALVAASAAVSGASCGASSTVSPHVFTCSSGIAADTTLTLQVTLGTGLNSQVSMSLPIKVASDTSTTALTVTGNSTINPGSTTTFGGTVCTGCTFTLEPAGKLNGTPAVVGTTLSATTNALQETTTFTLSVTNQVGVTTSVTQAITVRTPVITSFDAPTSWTTGKTGLTLSATFGPGAITGAAAASASVAATAGSNPTCTPPASTTGSQTFTCGIINQDTTFTLTVQLGSGLNSTATATVLVKVAPTQSLTAGNVMNAVRFGASLTLLPNGKVLIAGGSTTATGTSALNSAEVFDPATGNFLVAGQGVGCAGANVHMSDNRYQHTGTLLSNGKVLLVGGTTTGLAAGATTSADLYDVNADCFTALGPGTHLNTARFGHTATALPNGKVLIAGGTGTSGTALSSAELFDPLGAANQFTTVTGGAQPGLTSARTGATATLLNNGLVLIAGGAGAVAADQFDYTANSGGGQFAGTAGTELARRFHTATLLGGGKVLLVGGSSDGLAANVLTSAELYDPNAGTFTATASSLNTGRMLHTAVLMPAGTVFVAGGTNSSGNPLLSTELFDLTTGTFSFAASLSTARTQAVSSFLFNGSALVAGGVSPAARGDLFTP